ncbi:MAG: hypothetical protein ACKO04_14155 [Actinomycetes bacterium]
MALTEDSRYQLFQHLVEVLGRENASTLMEHLPPVGWADVATKQDFEHLRVATKQDFEHLRVATKRDIEQLRAQMQHEFAQRDIRFERIDQRFDQIDQRFDTFRLEMKADMERAFRMQTFALVGLMFTMLSAFLALQQSINS